MKYQMILAAEQKNLALRSRQFFTKRFCELYGRKPASDDNNSYGLHFLAPVTRGIDFHFPCKDNDFTARAKDTSVLRPSIGTKQCSVYGKCTNCIGIWLASNSRSIACKLGESAPCIFTCASGKWGPPSVEKIANSIFVLPMSPVISMTGSRGLFQLSFW